MSTSTVAEHVFFIDLCNLCQQISDKKEKDKKFQPLKHFFAQWRNFHSKLHAENSNVTDSFYPALRLLLPQCERQRAAYGIEEFTLAKLLIDIFCLDKNSVDAQKLMNYQSSNSARAEAEDFASVAYFVLKDRSPQNGKLTIYDINFHLDQIASNNANRNKDEVKHSLLHLLRNTSALEQKWLIRMILKDMKLGLSESSILYAFHPDARDLYDVTNSLEKVCVSLRDQSIRLHEIRLFSAFRPMLAEIALPSQVENLMPNKPFIIEAKYNGERLQVHKDGNSYMYFSRGGHDCTETYRRSPLHRSFTHLIHRAFKPEVSNCILDGEIVIYSSKLNCIVATGENADFQAMEPDGDYGPCVCIFDILLYNGIVLLNKPLKERIAYIKKTFNQVDNKIRFTEQKYVSTNDEVVEELNKAIDLRLEGIIVKDPESIYKPNVRKAGGWLKIKPEYVDNLISELDILIIGGYYVDGRRSKLISHFLLAVASSEQVNGEPKCFYSFCKVGSGYSLKELYELSAKLEQHWQPYNPKKPPPNLIIGGGIKEQPDVIIEPSQSQIVQVKATEIVRSTSFATDCTLRFPRVERIRYDKSWIDCMTKTEMEDLRNNLYLKSVQNNLSVENNSLKEKVKVLEKQLCNFEDQAEKSLNETYKDEYQDLQSQLNTYMFKNKELQNALSQCQCELEVVKKNENHLLQKVRELEETVDEKVSEISTYQEKMKKAREEIEELQSVIEILKSDQIDLKKQANPAFTDLDDRKTMEEQEYDALRNKATRSHESIRSIYGNFSYSYGLCGLRNLGNSCYMNAALQSLSNTPPLLQYFLDDDYIEEINIINPFGRKGDIAKSFGEIMKLLWCGTYNDIAPQKFKSHIGKVRSEFADYTQEDCEEFLTCLLDALHEDLSRGTKKTVTLDTAGQADEVVANEAWSNYQKLKNSIIIDLFHGMVKSSLQCVECSKVSSIFDPFGSLSMSLPVKTKRAVTLIDCLELFTRVEKLDNEDKWFCPSCKKHQKATKKMSFWVIPQVLIIHFKKFSYSNISRRKIEIFVEFPTKDLDMEKYLLNPSHGPAVYDLIAVVNHSGGAYGGHYTSYAKNKNTGLWYYFDDSRVTQSCEEEVVTKDAYILFYMRKEPIPIKPRHKRPRLSAAVGASSSNNMSSPHEKDNSCTLI